MALQDNRCHVSGMVYKIRGNGSDGFLRVGCGDNPYGFRHDATGRSMVSNHRPGGHHDGNFTAGCRIIWFDNCRYAIESTKEHGHEH